MSDVQQPLWLKEESVEGRAPAAFAFRHWTKVENMKADPGVARVETDGPFLDRQGMRGTTHLVGGGSTDWLVAEVELDRRLVIEVPLRDAILRFDIRFEEKAGGGCVLTQRVSLFGPGAAAHLEQVETGFGTSLGEGMRAVRDRIDATTP